MEDVYVITDKEDYMIGYFLEWQDARQYYIDNIGKRLGIYRVSDLKITPNEEWKHEDS